MSWLDEVLEIYAADWGPATGQEEWRTQLSPFSPEIVKSACRRVCQAHTGRYRPKLRDVVARCESMTPKDVREEAPTPDCLDCGNGGVGWTVKGRMGDDWGFAREGVQYEELRAEQHPCRCHHGNPHNDRILPMRDPRDQAQALVEGWLTFFKNEAEAQTWITQQEAGNGSAKQ